MVQLTSKYDGTFTRNWSSALPRKVGYFVIFLLTLSALDLTQRPEICRFWWNCWLGSGWCCVNTGAGAERERESWVWQKCLNVDCWDERVMMWGNVQHEDLKYLQISISWCQLTNTSISRDTVRSTEQHSSPELQRLTYLKIARQCSSSQQRRRHYRLGWEVCRSWCSNYCSHGRYWWKVCSVALQIMARPAGSLQSCRVLQASRWDNFQHKSCNYINMDI